MIDSHAHIAGEEFPDVDEVLARAREAGVREIIVVGADKDVTSARRAVALVEARPNLYAAIAIHPHDAARATGADFDEIAALAARPCVVAVGETGLDYHYDHSPPDAQRATFRRFVRMARDLHKPVVVHVRDAHDDARTILDEERAGDVGAIIHCFTGTAADAQAYLARGFWLSFSGIVTFKSADALRAVCAGVPADRLLLETDCPYLAPVPLRGKRNEPAFLVHTLRAVAAARGRPEAEVAQAATQATRAAFRLGSTLS
ncbi:MAG: TatD family hydrolase, partial [Myxococcota bacterium]